MDTAFMINILNRKVQDFHADADAFYAPLADLPDHRQQVALSRILTGFRRIHDAEDFDIAQVGYSLAMYEFVRPLPAVISCASLTCAQAYAYGWAASKALTTVGERLFQEIGGPSKGAKKNAQTAIATLLAKHEEELGAVQDYEDGEFCWWAMIGASPY